MSLVTAYLLPLPHHDEEISLLQRLLLVWCFLACGLVIALQIAQSWADPRPRWTVVDERNRQYWYTFYVLEAFLTMQVTYRPLLWKLEEVTAGGGRLFPWLGGGGGSSGGGLGLDLGVEFLDGLWIVLLGLEVAMVAGVLVSKALRMFSPNPNPAPPTPTRAKMKML